MRHKFNVNHEMYFIFWYCWDMLLLLVRSVFTFSHVILHNCDSVTFIVLIMWLKRAWRKLYLFHSLAVRGDISGNMNCEVLALLYTKIRARGRVANRCGSGIMVDVVALHVASLYCNYTLHIYTFQADDSVQSGLEARAVSFTAVCLWLAFIVCFVIYM